MKDKFLTVYAVFDDETQKILKSYQDEIFLNGIKGSQTMGIPFHISLGSFKLEEKDNLIAELDNLTKDIKPFNLELKKIGNFANKVLFIEPDISKELLNIQKLFDNNYADSKFSWHPHATIFIDEAGFENANTILKQNFKPFTAKIVGIQLGEFFPAKIIKTEYFKEYNLNL